jgi:hypothetical protein
MHGLETQLSALARQNLDSSTARHNQIVDVRTRISASELQLKKNGDIVSSYSGRVAEVFAAEDQVLTSGSRLLSLNIQVPNSAMMSVSYLPAKDGKNIQPGMAVQVIPDNVERNRFGGIVATVISVSPLPVTKEGALNIAAPSSHGDNGQRRHGPGIVDGTRLMGRSNGPASGRSIHCKRISLVFLARPRTHDVARHHHDCPRNDRAPRARKLRGSLVARRKWHLKTAKLGCRRGASDHQPSCRWRPRNVEPPR